MGNNRISPVIIGVLVLVLLAIAIFAFSLLSNKGGKDPGKTSSKDELITPILELSLNTSEPDQEKVTITAVATTDDKEGIDYIVLPDGSEIFAEEKDYDVTENGKYKFQVYGLNGASDTFTIEVKNIREVSASNPYVPEGFEHVEGEVDDGFVIEDEYGNQFVWVPVENGILTRTTMMKSEYEESNGTASNLVNSVAKNYGFYIARYESARFEKDEKPVATSVINQIPWSEVSYQDAYDASINAAEVYNYPEGVVTSLVNSYAWDTTLEWLNKSVANYSSNTSYGNYSGTIYTTGATTSDQINKVCDMAGNVREWTTEIYKASTTTTTKKTNKNTPDNIINRVVRGGSASINKVANSRNGYPEDLTDGYWGFRMILYKNS